jgi:threonine 3-dehydrogenase
VVITDVNPYRLELARKMGATWPSIPEKRLARRAEAARHEEGFDVGLEMSGNPQAASAT